MLLNQFLIIGGQILDILIIGRIFIGLMLVGHHSNINFVLRFESNLLLELLSKLLSVSILHLLNIAEITLLLFMELVVQLFQTGFMLVGGRSLLGRVIRLKIAD